MKKKKNNGIFAFFFCLLAIFLFFHGFAVIKAQLINEAQDPGSSVQSIEDMKLKPEIKKGSPKIESVLRQLITIYQNEGLVKAQEFAQKRGVDLDNELVQIVVEAKELHSQSVHNKIDEMGGMVQTSFKNLTQALFPVYSLKQLAETENISYIRLPIKPHLTEIISEGVQVTGANELQNVFFHPSENPVKVAILDAGFKGYRELLGSELPDLVVTRSFRQDRNIIASYHGTACAEIVHDMAPNAKLYLVNYSTLVEHHYAVDYLIDKKVDIISYSMGWWKNVGPGDGTGPINDEVRRAANNGIVWVTAAGNFAQRHWEGIFNDPDNDGWHNFSGSDEGLSIEANDDRIICVFLTWDDWYNSNQDYNLYLYHNGSLVASSENYQTGSQWPTEAIYYRSPSLGKYDIFVRKHNANRNVKLEIFTCAHDLEYVVSSRSLDIPADSEYSVAVGATHWWDDQLAQFSSQGPTSDGRIKPDLTAPTYVQCYAVQRYRNRTYFGGTSAATPHVAGAFALAKSQLGIYTFEDIKQILFFRAIDFAPEGKDNQYGYGRLNLRQIP